MQGCDADFDHSYIKQKGEREDEPEAELVVGDVSSEIEPKGKGKVDQRLCSKYTMNKQEGISPC
ncbi:hypothetical protein F2Q70_00033415 [Brassica cretica]|uniref:Uncharacterized protein n=1 Tax=Brassica cretica TaxID=69181 RepID=A0A8S9FBA6_BRACR|nr:hypothetical protein F2Q70_00033415 [Brassica cretica]KAF2553027.1 hypothetical protein F2Q68_00037734 [Brassica cretica]